MKLFHRFSENTFTKLLWYQWKSDSRVMTLHSRWLIDWELISQYRRYWRNLCFFGMYEWVYQKSSQHNAAGAKVHNAQCIEVSNTLKPSHCWTHGPWPLKTIETNDWKTPKPSKNHWNQWSGGWKSFNGDDWLTPKPSENQWKQWSVGWRTSNGNG